MYPRTDGLAVQRRGTGGTLLASLGSCSSLVVLSSRWLPSDSTRVSLTVPNSGENGCGRVGC